MDQNIIIPIHGLEYWVGQMKEIEIYRKVSKALIDGSAMISMMSKGYCDENGYKIQHVVKLVPIEGNGGADVPYLGYV